MSLLTLEGVDKRYRRGRREYVALTNASLSVEHAELVAVLGTRKSGRSTLLRIAAGLERPDHGKVRFEGIDPSHALNVIGRRLAYCSKHFSALEGDLVIEHVGARLLAQDIAPLAARKAAERALAKAGASDCMFMAPNELDSSESMRVAIARALVSSPALLVVDEPTVALGALQVDPLLHLLRSVADEGVAVLMSTGDAICLSGADRVMSLDEGELRGEADPPDAYIRQLRPVPLRLAPEAEADTG